MKRLAQMQNDGPVYVSTIVLSDEEGAEQLEGEAFLHEASGWRVERVGDRLVCTKMDVVRTLWLEDYDPMAAG